LGVGIWDLAVSGRFDRYLHGFYSDFAKGGHPGGGGVVPFTGRVRFLYVEWRARTYHSLFTYLEAKCFPI